MQPAALRSFGDEPVQGPEVFGIQGLDRSGECGACLPRDCCFVALLKSSKRRCVAGVAVWASKDAAIVKTLNTEFFQSCGDVMA